MTQQELIVLDLARKGLLIVNLHYPYRGSGVVRKSFMSRTPPETTKQRFSQRVAVRLFNRDIIETGGLVSGDATIMGTFKVRISPKFEQKMKELTLNDIEHCPNLISEEYDYRGFHFQRLNHNYMWYVTHTNKIVNWGQYQNDLKEWVDIQYERKKV